VVKLIPSYTQMSLFLEKEYLPYLRLSEGYPIFLMEISFINYTFNNGRQQISPSKEIHAIELQEVYKIRAEMELIKKESGFKGTLKEFMIKLNLENQIHYKNTEEILAVFNSVKRELLLTSKRYWRKFPKQILKFDKPKDLERLLLHQNIK